MKNQQLGSFRPLFTGGMWIALLLMEFPTRDAAGCQRDQVAP